jgi:transposase
MSTRRKPVILNDSEREKLEKICRARKEEVRRVRSASIILAAASGATNKEISLTLDISVASVSNTLQKFYKYGIDGALADVQRSGRPCVIDDEAIAWVLSLANRKPKDFLKPDGQTPLPEELWSLRRLMKYIKENCLKYGHKCLEKLALSKLWTILKENGIKLGRIRSVLSKTDPEYDAKEKEIIDVHREAAQEREKNEAKSPEEREEDERKAFANRQREDEERKRIDEEYLKGKQEEEERKKAKIIEDELKNDNNETLKDLKIKLQEQKNERQNLDKYKNEIRKRNKGECKEIKQKLKELKQLKLKAEKPQELERIEQEIINLEKQFLQMQQKYIERMNEVVEKKKLISQEIEIIKSEQNNLKRLKREQKERRLAEENRKKEERQEQYAQNYKLFEEERKKLVDNNGNDDKKEKVAILSLDEKPGIQALKNVSPDLMDVSGYGSIGRDPEYIRLGIIDLFAVLDLITGIVTFLTRPEHKSRDFIDFLRIIDAKYMEYDRIKIILDNHSIHFSAETKEFLESRPGRFEFIPTPKHSSWLNPVESFFSKLSRQLLKDIRVESKEELAERINIYGEGINEEPVIYKWTYKIEEDDTAVAA